MTVSDPYQFVPSSPPPTTDDSVPFEQTIRTQAKMAGIPEDVGIRLVGAESSYDPRAKSGVGALGLTQLMPDTAKMLGVSDPFNAAENLAGGFKYLAGLKERFGSWSHALAAYNWGPGNVKAWLDAGGDLSKLPAETRAYIKKIAPTETTATASTQPRKRKFGLLQQTSERTPHDPYRFQGASTPAPDPYGFNQPAQQPGAASLLPSEGEQLAESLEQHGQEGYAHLLRMADNAADSPLSILNAVLGSAQRFNAASSAQKIGELKSRDPRAIIPPFYDPQSIGAGLYGVFHPNDPSVEAKAEEAIGLKPAQGDSLGARVRNFAQDMGFQIGTDPFFFGGGATAKIGNEAIRATSALVTKAMLTNPNAKVRDLIAAFIAHPQIRAGFTPSGQAIFKGVVNSEDTAMQRQAAQDAKLLSNKANKDVIATGQVPPELEQRMLHDAYVYGTHEMRQQAIDKGYKPTEEEAAHDPENILHYNLKENYFPHYGDKDLPEEYAVSSTPLGASPQSHEPIAGFEKPQDGKLKTDPIRSMELRLANARAVIRHRMTQKRLSEETGVTLDATKVPTDTAKTAQHVTDSAAAEQAIRQPRPQPVKGFDLLKDVGNLERDVLISSNFLPHAKNIGVLSYLAGGAVGLARGLQYAMAGVPKELAERLEHYGAGGHFMLTQPGKLSTARLVPSFIRRGNQAALDRVDMGMRAARLRQIDKLYPNISEYEKAEKVNEDIGAYRDSPQYVQLLRNMLGAQFPQWHGYIVPTTVARAILRNPGRVQQVVRTQGLANQDLLGPNSDYDIEMGGPVTEFGTMTQMPGEMLLGRRPTFLTSPSMLGPFLSPIAKMGTQSQSYQPPGVLSTIIPYYSILAPKFGINPFNSKAPANVRSIAAFFAAYPKARESAYEMRIRDLMEQEGLDRMGAQKRAQQEMRELLRLTR